ncbi:DUF3142 domain-containing protein [Granulicella sp. dw_53]|uniref:DUF3142 domain-containing protein n=1 Tax=Granulicella sp. dw_53 TaxID=2719792 RepID=UPI001BD26FE8|nr:DUF3142 domain-containing protein [Granulicella sp. dw_53]
MKWKVPATVLILATAVLLLALRIHAHATHDLAPPQLARNFPATMPATVLWAWEEPEDLTTLDPTRTGVAYLAETLTLSDHLTRRPRFQPLRVAPGASVMAVVRIQPTTTFRDTPALRTATAEALATVARQPNLRALQVDFDATRSQRDFYSAILHQLRPRMPAAMPLSITALVSWCSTGDAAGNWLASLPIDEAVPMYFRLGGTSKPTADKTDYRLRQPLCRTSTGVSTDESWPTLTAASRLYLFAPQPWTAHQIAAINTTPNAVLHQELHP